MTQVNVYLMHGFIGSGKTTQAKQLEKQLGAYRFNPDSWMACIFGENPPSSFFDQALEGIWKQVEPLLFKLAKSGTPIIYDSGFWTKTSRIEVEKRLKNQNLSFKWIILDTPLDECRQRTLLRNDSPDKTLYIAPETFDQLAKNFEPIDLISNNN